MTQQRFNDLLRQLFVLFLVCALGFLLISQITSFIPGLLGGITLYILSRAMYFKLVYRRKWKKGWTALLFMLAYIIIISIPIYFSITLITPKIRELITNQDQIKESVAVISDKLEKATGMQIFSAQSTSNISQKISAFIPKLINSTTNVLTNLLMMFFLFYYLLVNGSYVEKKLNKLIPLKPSNINSLASESKMMIRANALGIPAICLIQGLVATLGYFLFGVTDWGLWGFVTGVFAFFPIVGTMIIWVPVVIMMFTAGHNASALALTLYSIIITGNVDYLARITLLKKMGNVHPMVTVLGVIVGLNLFGFVGLIFGPLLVSYFLIMVKIYVNEFGDEREEIHSPQKET